MAQERCTLVGNQFGWYIQIFLFLLSFSVLVCKKYCDKLKRTWGVWFMVFNDNQQDSSKQIIGSGLLHVYNVVSADLLVKAKGNEKIDTCQWYFATFMFDIIFITLMSWILLMLTQALLRKCCPKYAFTTGVYYSQEAQNQRNEESIVASQIEMEGDSKSDSFNSTQPSLEQIPTRRKKTPFKSWLYQLLIWLIILTVAKSIIVLILWALKDEIGWLVGKILSFLIDYPKYELIAVMVVVPVICNAIQYWITDSFIKSKKTAPKKKNKVLSDDKSPPISNPNECQDFSPYNPSPHADNENPGASKKSDKSLLLDHED